MTSEPRGEDQAPVRPSDDEELRTGELDGLIRRAIDPLALMQRVADQALAMIEAADGVLVGLVIDDRSLRYACGAGYLNCFVGEALALEGSLSGLAIRSRRTLRTGDSESDPRVNRVATRAFNVRSSVCVPLGLGEQPVGVLNVSSARLEAFAEHDVQMLSGLADFISTVIGAASEFMAITARLLDGRRRPAAGAAADAEAAGRFVVNVLDPEAGRTHDERARIERILEQADYSLVFQPIFDLARGQVFGLEALARFGGEGCPPPDVWFEQAHGVGLGVELEVALFEAAIARLAALPGDVLLAINAGPEALASPRITAAVKSVDPARIIIELTEHAAVEDYPQLAVRLAALRDCGVRLAIDDAGAGFASLMHILKLAPDFIKLDRELISGIDLDPVRRSLADSLKRFAADTGATLIAEGVENETELAALSELGIGHAQGFHLARPAPIEELGRLRADAAARLAPHVCRATAGGSERATRAASLRG